MKMANGPTLLNTGGKIPHVLAALNEAPYDIA